MTQATLRVVIPGGIEDVFQLVDALRDHLSSSPLNPNHKKILAWTYQGDEIDLPRWSIEKVVSLQVQGITFWLDERDDYFCSWYQTTKNLWSVGFGFSLSTNLPELIFGYLARTAATTGRSFFGDQAAIVFSFE
jgi:hypothetical protein